MPTEIKYMVAWVLTAFGCIALIIWLWLANSARIQNPAIYGTPADIASLQSPHTPFIVPQVRQATNVSSIAQSLPDSTRFSALLHDSGVDNLIDSGQQYTVFVPTDRAVRQLPGGLLQNMSATDLKRLVEYHVVVGQIIDINAVDTGFVTALSKDIINIQLNPGDQSARVNGSVVLEAYKGKNGIVYLINSVLLPPTAPATN